MVKDMDDSKKRDTNVEHDDQLEIELSLYQVLAKWERDRGSTSKKKKTAAEMKNELVAVKSGLAAWRKKAQSGSQSTMLASVLKQYLAEMETDCAKREEPKQAQAQTAPPQTDGGPTSPGPRLRPGLMALLPDLCLLTVFRQLPLEDQFTTQRVCRRFAVLGQEVMRNRRSLTLLFGQSELHQIRHLLAWEADLQLGADERSLLELVRKADGSPQFPTRPVTKWNSLCYDAPTEAIVLELGSTFSSITKLQVGLWENDYHGTQIDSTTFTSLARLLEELPQLVTFRFFEHIKFYIITSETHDKPDDDFYRALSSLRHLKHLTLCLDWDTCPLDKLTPTFISQLDVLNFRDFFGSGDFSLSGLLQELNDLEQGNDLQHLPALYFYCRSSDVKLNGLSRLSGPFRRQLKQLHSNHAYFTEPSDLHYLDQHCGLFQSLVTLVLSSFARVPFISWRAILRAIVQLPQLVYLKLDTEVLILETPDRLPSLPQLPSLKVLQLTSLVIQSHRHLEAMQLGWTMPNLQVLKIELGYGCCEDCQGTRLIFYNKCDQCGHLFDDHHPVEGQVLDCYRQLFRGLKRDCLQLHTIRHNFENTLGTVEQLLADGQG